MKRRPDHSQPLVSHVSEIGVAYERERQASEFGLPENFDDPNAYRGKTPPCDPIIGQ